MYTFVKWRSPERTGENHDAKPPRARIIFYFVAMWLGACLLIVRFGGWGGLAKQYRVEKLPPGKRYHFQSASLTRAGMPCNYGSCLTLVVCEHGWAWRFFRSFVRGIRRC